MPGRVAELARSLVSGSGTGSATGSGSGAGSGTKRSVRVGIDGPVEADTSGFADAVAAELESSTVPVARVSARDFLRARSIRFERGRDDPDACYDLWYDVPALRREVLDPLAPGEGPRSFRGLTNSGPGLMARAGVRSSRAARSPCLWRRRWR